MLSPGPQGHVCAAGDIDMSTATDQGRRAGKKGKRATSQAKEPAQQVVEAPEVPGPDAGVVAVTAPVTASTNVAANGTANGAAKHPAGLLWSLEKCMT